MAGGGGEGWGGGGSKAWSAYPSAPCHAERGLPPARLPDWCTPQCRSPARHGRALGSLEAWRMGEEGGGVHYLQDARLWGLAHLGAAIGARHDFGEPTSTDGETHAWRNTQFEGIPDTTRGPSRTTAPPRRRRHARSPSTTLKPAPRSLSLLPDSLHSLHCRGRQPRRGPARASAAKTITQRWSQTCGRLALTRLLQPRACGPSGPAWSKESRVRIQSTC